MNKSDTITKISSALVKAQRKMTNVLKGDSNPFFKSKYAGLPDVMDACKEHLNSEGISVLQSNGKDEKGHYVETTLLHESGEWVESRLYLVLSKQDMQGLGASCTYARRFDLQSFVFLGAIDDDGESAVNRSTLAEPPKNVVSKSDRPAFKPKAVTPVANGSKVADNGSEW